MPRSRSARMTRTAISPRLATSTRRKSGRSERDVPMLLRRVLVALVLQHPQRADQPRARVLGQDDRVDVAELGGLERVREGPAIVLLEPLALGGGVGGALDLVWESGFYCNGGAHHPDLGGWVGEVYVAADVL